MLSKLSLKSLALAELGLHEDATATRNQVFAMNPENVHAILSQAIALQDQGKYNEALQVSQRALDLDGNNHHSLIIHAETLSKLPIPNPIGALEHYEKAVEILPNNSDSMLGQEAEEDKSTIIISLAMISVLIPIILASTILFRHKEEIQKILSKKDDHISSQYYGNKR